MREPGVSSSPSLGRARARRSTEQLVRVALRRARSLSRRILPRRKPPPGDLRSAFSSLDQWQAFARAHPQVRDPAYIKAIAREAGVRGVESAFLGRVPPHKVSVPTGNYREQLFAAGLNPRQRAIMELFS